MNNHDKNGSAGASDLWVRFENNAISNVAILLARPNEVNFVVIAGSIRQKQDEVLGIFLRQDLQKNLKAFRIGRRHD